MTDKSPSFETADILGRTKTFVGTVGTSAISIPTVADGRITEALVICEIDNANTARLQHDFANSSTFGDGLNKGAYIGWSIKNTPADATISIQQIQIKGNQAGVKYYIILNFET